MIAIRLKIHALDAREVSSHVSNARAELDKVSNSPTHTPWLMAAFGGLIVVTLGATLAGTTGAIAGAVFSYFIGHAAVNNAKAVRAREVRSAERDLNEWIETARTKEARPKYFAISESHTGERDRAFDAQSAYSQVSSAKS